MTQTNGKDPMNHAAAGRTLVIMAKAPASGRAKTRLAECLPAAVIPDFYRCLLNDTLRLAHSLDGVQTALMCPAADVEELSRLAGHAATVVGQEGIGLAAALNSVFQRFTGPGRRSVVAFNSDSPHLPAAVLHHAFDLLASNDLVIGPTHDGGYYLVGAAAAHPDLFVNETLGTANALDALLQRAGSLALSSGFTQRFYDVDVRADLNQLAKELRSAPERAPQTAQWLSDWFKPA